MKHSRACEACPSARLPRLSLAILAHALLRVASSANGVVIGVWLSGLSRPGSRIDAALVGALAASSYGAELMGSVPFGVAADAVPVRTLMSAGALLGALATLLFGLHAWVPLFFLSRLLEGLAVAAVTPALLRLLATSTAHEPSRRARVMSGFELSLLAGLALGALVGSQLWVELRRSTFGVLALLYGVCALLLFISVPSSAGRDRAAALRGLRCALQNMGVRRLAPVWLCVNAIIGIWLGPTLSFVLSERNASGQYLDGIFRSSPTDIGWLMLAYAVVFAIGVTLWAPRLPRIGARRAMGISLWAMLAVCAALGLLDHSAPWPDWSRAVLGVGIVLLIMLESGFGPAALTWLAQSLDRAAGTGAAMGIYSLLLSLGALGGALLGGWAAAHWRMDGLLLVTALLAVCALALLPRISTTARDGRPRAHDEEPA